MKEYTYPKKEFIPEDISRIALFFKNGDYLTIRGNEILSIELSLYDELFWHGRELAPEASGGLIRLRIHGSRGRDDYDEYLLYDPDEYEKHRRFYFKRRLIDEGGITKLIVFDHNNWNMPLLGNIVAEDDGGIIVLRFLPNPCRAEGADNGDTHRVKLCNPDQVRIEKITLDFENCDVYDVYEDEIIDMQLSFREELEWNSSGIARVLDCGSIKLKLDNAITWRHANIFGFSEKKSRSISRLIRRLTETPSDMLDICHLYVEYSYLGYCITHEERICVPALNAAPEAQRDGFDPYDDFDDEDDCYGTYESGYAEKNRDGSITIILGRRRG